MAPTSRTSVFGCDAYALLKDHQPKFHPKAEKCIFVGYAENSKAYRLWNNEKRRIIISRDVKFNELNVTIPSVTIQDIDTQENPNENEKEDNDMITIIRDSPPTSKTKSHMAKQLESDLGPYWEQAEQATYAYALTAASILIEPQTIKEAQSSPDAAKWKKAMDEEYASLIENKTWNLTHLPPNRETVNVRWLCSNSHPFEQFYP